jgi:hypothetical protein
MAAFSKLKVGDILWDYHSERAGNTTMRRWGNWPVRIIELYPERRAALASWNTNRPRIFYERELKRLRWTKGKEQ